jgi:hypothetical protein
MKRTALRTLSRAAVCDGCGLQRVAARTRRGARAGAIVARDAAVQDARGVQPCTHQDQHSVLVDYDVFMNVPRPNAQDVATVQTVYKAEAFDFRLKPGSAAVDRGKTLPNVTDGFAGAAPDLGAIELGATAPHYGPRN